VDFLHQFFDMGVPKKDKLRPVWHFVDTALGVSRRPVRSMVVKVRQPTTATHKIRWH
jgi:hypothetical protein